MDNWKIVLTNQMPRTRKSNKHDENHSNDTYTVQINKQTNINYTISVVLLDNES